ncbi:MAG TPA: DUF2069 domain-containing protein [Rhodocyclaceae bacterium]|nr:DUF2069 domain-containing protein [Rhodocyclaceae bacterium]
MTPTRIQTAASTCLIALTLLCLAWELWLAPLRPGGSWLVLKAALLLAPLFGVLRGRRYTYKWLSLFILLYFAEGLVRATGDHGVARLLAIAETGLSFALFALSILFVRSTRAREPSTPPEPR